MRLRRTVINHSSKLGRAFGLLLVSTVLIVSFVASSPSLSKYVLDSVGADLTFLSGSMGSLLEGSVSIQGTTRQYETLVAVPIIPSEATYSYQWQRANTSDGVFIDILGANASSFYLDIENNNHFIRVALIGTGDYSGTIYSPTAGPVVLAAIDVESMGPIQGNPVVGQTVTVGALTPIEATANYQWKISNSIDGTYTDLAGATNSTLAITESMVDKFVRAYATGSNNYSGVVYATLGPIRSDKIALTSIDNTSGTTQIGLTLTAGALSPAGATATYQWQRSDASGSIFSDILGATSPTYTPIDPDDLGLYLRVVATGTGDYSGVVISTRNGPVVSASTPITSLGNISGTVQVGSTLTAGILSPTGATATYQWWISNTGNEPWSMISGATISSYTLTAADFGKYIKVIATGAGSFSESRVSGVVGPVAAMPLQSIGNISGSTIPGAIVTAGTVTPVGATVNYQWQYSSSPLTGYTNISGATSITYVLGYSSGYVRVQATGTGSYSGAVTSNYIEIYTGSNLINITSIADSIGLTQVFQTLTAGTVSPYGATVTYQWQRSDSMNGVYSNVPNATSKTLALTGADKGYYFKVIATGSGSYYGSVISRYAGPITAAPLTAIGNISGTATTGQTLTAGAVTPAGATVTYQWLRSDINGENYVPILGATGNTYGVVASDVDKYLKVQVTGTNLYTGTITSQFTGPVLTTPTQITALGGIIGIPQVGQVLTTGNTTPVGATVTYQWLRADTPGGEYAPISGATSATYTTTPTDLNKYIKVTIFGAGTFTTLPTYPEGITSTSFGAITARPLEAISNIIGRAEVGQVFTAGTVTPIGANVTYQWQSSVNGNDYTDISGANSNTYTITLSDNAKRIRVQAIGIGGYSGTVNSNSNGPIGSPNSILLITDSTGITRVGQTLTAGTVIPYGATVTYQWLRSDTIDGTYEAIAGANNRTYVLTATEQNKYVKVIATGYGLYFGEVISNATDLIAKGIVTNLGPISGQMVKNQTVSVGAINPLGATVTYQWQRSADGISYSNITGATANSYQLAQADVNMKIKLVITGTGAYEGTATSPESSSVQGNATGLISLSSIGLPTGTTSVGEVLTAGNVLPSLSLYTIQWQRSPDGSNFVDIPGATFSSYTLTAQDFNQYIRIKAVGYDTHTGTVYSQSPHRQVLGQQAITNMGGISGTPALGQVLQAGAITPAGATVNYQWYLHSDSNPNPDTGTFTAIIGATDSVLQIPLNGSPTINNYLKLTITGYGAYSGSITSMYFGPITQSPSSITTVSPILGTPRVNSTLSAGTITPYGAAVTYQWLRRSIGAETFAEIPGATSSTYVLTAQDYNTNLKVVVTGAGGYYGWAESETTSLVQAGNLISISPIIGSTIVGQTLTAGSLNPYGATVEYQWMRSLSGGGYGAIEGATSSNYTLTTNDLGKLLKVQATGYGAYSGSVLSAESGPVVNTAATPISGPLSITGTVRVNSTLTVSGITPSVSTVTYQWQRSDGAGGYIPIGGAIGPSYLLTAQDWLKTIRVVVTGAGAYSEILTSSPTGPVAPAIITATTGGYTPSTEQHVNRSVQAFEISPANATVTYKWEIGKNKQWADIGITTSSALIPPFNIGNNSGTVGDWIRVTITGTDAYGGGPALVGYGSNVKILADVSLLPLVSISPVVGTSAVGQVLTAGTISPAGATVNYQWQRSTTSSGTFENVSGAISSTYTLQSADLGYYFRVMVTGNGNYTGVLNSVSTGPVIASGSTIPIISISDILYTTVPNLILTAGTVTPLNATVTYQWMYSTTTNPDGSYNPNGSYSDISGATGSNYTVAPNEVLGRYFRVRVTGSGSYSGSVTSNFTGPVVATAIPLESIEISGINQVGKTLTAFNLQPTGATATYQWQVFTGAGGIYVNIPGGNFPTYTLQPEHYNYYIRLIATGSGAYTGSVFTDTPSKVVGIISSAHITMASPALGVKPQTATEIEAINSHADYKVSAVSWNGTLTPAGNFKADTTYSATLTLESQNTKTFVPTEALFTAMVPGATSIGSHTTNGTSIGNTVTFTATFAPTGPLMPTSISVSTQPAKLVYVETTDGTLALDGMEVTETNNDGTTTTSIFTDGTATGYTAAPADGSTLTGAQHNTPVTVTHTTSGKTATTNNLTVEAPPSATNVTISGTAAVGSTLTGSYSYGDVNSDLEGTSTYRWLADGTAISGATSNTYVLTALEAGTNIQFEVTPVALTGTLTGLSVLSSATQDVASASLGAATVTMTAPVLGATPQAAAGVEAATLNDYFTVTSLTWNEALTAGGKFKADTVYTATITLTSKNDTTFQETAFTPTVTTASSVGSTTTSDLGIGNTVTFTVSFPQTGALVVTDLTILTPPSDMSYVEMTNDTLSLDGLVLTTTHNDGSTTQVTFTDGAAVGYTTSPAHGTTLTNALHDGQPIMITHTASTETVTTGNLVVQAQAAPTATDVSISGTAQVGQTLTGSYTYADTNGDLEGTSTYQWLAAGSEITGATSTTYVVQAADVGKVITFKVTPAAATGLSPGLTVESSPTTSVIP